MLTLKEEQFIKKGEKIFILLVITIVTAISIFKPGELIHTIFVVVFFISIGHIMGFILIGVLFGKKTREKAMEFTIMNWYQPISFAIAVVFTILYMLIDLLLGIPFLDFLFYYLFFVFTDLHIIIDKFLVIEQSLSIAIVVMFTFASLIITYVTTGYYIYKNKDFEKGILFK